MFLTRFFMDKTGGFFWGPGRNKRRIFDIKKCPPHLFNAEDYLVSAIAISHIPQAGKLQLRILLCCTLPESRLPRPTSLGAPNRPQTEGPKLVNRQYRNQTNLPRRT